MIRFWRRLKIAPGINLNFSKRGISTSIGTRGAHVTIGKRTTVSAGLPGSGVSVRESFEKKPFEECDCFMCAGAEQLPHEPVAMGCAYGAVIGLGILFMLFVIGEIIAHA